MLFENNKIVNACNEFINKYSGEIKTDNENVYKFLTNSRISCLLYTSFDKADISAENIKVTKEEIEEAYNSLENPELVDIIKMCIRDRDKKGI